jgi:hypothetical protein
VFSIVSGSATTSGEDQSDSRLIKSAADEIFVRTRCCFGTCLEENYISNIDEDYAYCSGGKRAGVNKIKGANVTTEKVNVSMRLKFLFSREITY